MRKTYTNQKEPKKKRSDEHGITGDFYNYQGREDDQVLQEEGVQEGAAQEGRTPEHVCVLCGCKMSTEPKTLAEVMATLSDSDLITLLPYIRDENGEKVNLIELKHYLRKVKEERSNGTD